MLDGPQPKHDRRAAVLVLLANLSACLLDLLTIEAHLPLVRLQRRSGRVMTRYTPLSYPEPEASRAEVESLRRLSQAQRRALPSNGPGLGVVHSMETVRAVAVDPPLLSLRQRFSIVDPLEDDPLERPGTALEPGCLERAIRMARALERRSMLSPPGVDVQRTANIHGTVDEIPHGVDTHPDL
jgi:hypothetical protein